MECLASTRREVSKSRLSTVSCDDLSWGPTRGLECPWPRTNTYTKLARLFALRAAVPNSRRVPKTWQLLETWYFAPV